MKSLKIGLLLFALHLVACNTSNNSNTPMDNSVAISIDGIIDANEWKTSRVYDIASENKLYLVQDEAYVYMAIKRDAKVARYVDVYLTNDSNELINLHASMQLGERLLIGNWDDNNPAWKWGNNDGWQSNTARIIKKGNDLSFLETLKPYDGYEFKISKKKIKSNNFKLRIEIKDFIGEAEEITFPKNTDRKEQKNWFQINL